MNNFGSFETKEDFRSYFENHYEPLLAKMQEGYYLSLEDIRLIRFLYDDLKTFFND